MLPERLGASGFRVYGLPKERERERTERERGESKREREGGGGREAGRMTLRPAQAVGSENTDCRAANG